MNPWHEVNIGEDAPNVINAIIEIPKNTRAKYELCKKTGLLKLDKVLYSSMCYPIDYGFVPKTYCDDQDPLDILVLSQISIVPMCIVKAKVIGVMRMKDGERIDDKIIAVAADDVSVNQISSIDELPEHVKMELRNFFRDYQAEENRTLMFEEIQDKQLASEIVVQAISDYKSKFV